MAHRIEDYALIGDCESAALVGRDGSLDWLCWPRFDSSACFAALLGSREHGRWIITPVGDDVRIQRRYRRHTLVLETRFETPAGTVTLTDFMPPRGANAAIVRLVRGIRGRVRLRTELILRFDYGRVVPWVNRLPDGTWRAIAGPDMVTLHTPVRLRGQEMTSFAEFEVGAGETVPFVLTYGASHLEPAAPVDPRRALRATETFWSRWAAKSAIDEEVSDAVIRSLLVLKALTYDRTGCIIAAPTTSLPEQLGGARNWDYRFCWLRDATLTLQALMDAGYFEEARAWRDWLLRAAAGAPSQLQAMYGLGGERRLPEWIADWLPGYDQSQPVRIGNAAHEQLQLDVYGEVIDALYQAQLGGLAAHPTAWAFQLALLEHLERIWEQPDEGIWEVRGGRQHFTYSKVMAWVAFDRAIKSADALRLEGPVRRWRAVRHRIHADVCARGFDPEIGSFVQAYGSKQLDASLLLLPKTGFLPATDPRVRGTIEAIERRLTHNGLVLRYDTTATADGLTPGEGAFLACSFWLADAYVAIGRLRQARALFDHLLALRNDVGLLAEEYDTGADRQVGNFPQAFSHIALVNSAFALRCAGAVAGPAVRRPGADRQKTRLRKIA